MVKMACYLPLQKFRRGQKCALNYAKRRIGRWNKQNYIRMNL